MALHLPYAAVVLSSLTLFHTRSDATGGPQLQALNCSTAGNHSSSDAYAANLNQLLVAMPENAVSNNGGFFKGTVGEGSASTVYGLAMCSAEFSRKNCDDCLAAATAGAGGLVKRCPGSTTVAAVFDQCVLRYSNHDFFGTAETDIMFMRIDPSVSSKITYSDKLRHGLAPLGAQAAASPERFAARETSPYALLQCTRDLPSDRCKACLDTLSANASDLLATATEGERKSFSCRVRYSNSSFMAVPLVTPRRHPPRRKAQCIFSIKPPK